MQKNSALSALSFLALACLMACGSDRWNYGMYDSLESGFHKIHGRGQPDSCVLRILEEHDSAWHRYGTLTTQSGLGAIRLEAESHPDKKRVFYLNDAPIAKEGVLREVAETLKKNCYDHFKGLGGDPKEYALDVFGKRPL